MRQAGPSIRVKFCFKKCAIRAERTAVESAVWARAFGTVKESLRKASFPNALDEQISREAFVAVMPSEFSRCSSLWTGGLNDSSLVEKIIERVLEKACHKLRLFVASQVWQALRRSRSALRAQLRSSGHPFGAWLLSSDLNNCARQCSL